MQTYNKIIYIQDSIIDEMNNLANNHYPLEVGGVLIGYINNDKVVVTDIVGPGPKAKHKRNSFLPDYKYQEEKIKKIYKQSDRTKVYIGDWHTHPNGSNELSGSDIKVLENISGYSKAKLPFPNMAILSGKNEKWVIKFWQFRYQKFTILKFSRRIIELDSRIY